MYTRWCHKLEDQICKRAKDHSQQNRFSGGELHRSKNPPCHNCIVGTTASLAFIGIVSNRLASTQFTRQQCGQQELTIW